MLCDVLEKTGIAGTPGEWIGPYWDDQDLFTLHNCRDINSLKERLWQLGTTPNGVSGNNTTFMGHQFVRMMENLKSAANLPVGFTPMDAWEYLFPNHRHIFLTRRNKLRQAISWWKAIQTDIWHKTADDGPAGGTALEEKYNFNAISHLMQEAAASESMLQELFSQKSITPLNIFYEDMAADIPGTVRRILDFLELDHQGVEIPESKYRKLSDEISEKWYERLIGDLSGEWAVELH